MLWGRKKVGKEGERKTAAKMKMMTATEKKKKKTGAVAVFNCQQIRC